MFYRSQPQRIIALLTDFGFKDSYVGVMKAVILGRAPAANIVDLCHNVMPQDVIEGAFVLSSSYPYFPEGAIFVCVVDPGVGTSRRIICVETAAHLFLAPDNGLLSVVCSESPSRTVFEVTSEEFFLKPVSSTFHGRDIFASVAGHLAAGVEPSRLGPKTTRMASLDLPRPVRTVEGSLRGQVVYVDQFGNIITNVTQTAITANLAPDPDRITVSIRGHEIRGISKTYDDVPKDRLLSLIGSSGYLEISINRGSAQDLLKTERGDDLTLVAE